MELNTYQGHFPDKVPGTDRICRSPVFRSHPTDMGSTIWLGTSGSGPPIGITLYFNQLAQAGGVARNPKGPDSPFDPAEPNEKKKVHRGGIRILCTDGPCSRYMVGTRGKGEITTGTNHLGFRCVSDPGKVAPQGHPILKVQFR